MGCCGNLRQSQCWVYGSKTRGGIVLGILTAILGIILNALDRKLTSRFAARGQGLQETESRTGGIRLKGPRDPIRRMEIMMRKIMVLLVLTLLLASVAVADTLYLKNGQQGQVIFIGFENDQFIFALANGYTFRVKIDQVERVVINRPRSQRGWSDSDFRRDRDDSSFSGSSRSSQWESSDAFDIRPERRWFRSSIQVSNGQQVRVEASGTVTLDGRTAVTADGLQGQRDRNAPMPNENVGALIATIGQDYNSPAIRIGRNREFIADRNGVLYFMINQSSAANARGAFRVSVSVNRETNDRDYGWNRRSAGTMKGQERTIIINANQPWTDTNIPIEPNMTIEIVAEGQIAYGVSRTTGPNGTRSASLNTSQYPVQTAGVGALIAKIRYLDGHDSDVIFIGSRNQAHTGRNDNGHLWLGVNDDNYRDNSGSYRVTVRW